MGGVRADLACGDERDLLNDGDSSKSCDPRRPSDYADHLRFELLGGSVRLVRHADQWQSTDGMLGARG